MCSIKGREFYGFNFDDNFHLKNNPKFIPRFTRGSYTLINLCLVRIAEVNDTASFKIKLTFYYSISGLQYIRNLTLKITFMNATQKKFVSNIKFTNSSHINVLVVQLKCIIISNIYNLFCFFVVRLLQLRFSSHNNTLIIAIRVSIYF